MLSAIKKLFSPGPKVDLSTIYEKGAQVIDVRSIAEYKQGHLKGSVNIPLGTLSGQAHRLDKQKPVITCCASGMRSTQARSILQSKGFQEVYNGGGWMSLQNKIR